MKMVNIYILQIGFYNIISLLYITFLYFTAGACTNDCTLSCRDIVYSNGAVPRGREELEVGFAAEPRPLRRRQQPQSTGLPESTES